VFSGLAVLLAACTAPSPPPAASAFYIFRLVPPALIQLSQYNQILAELPVSFPPDCRLFDIFPPPRGGFLAVELSCSFGQTVLFLDSASGSVTKAFDQSDSHFLAWSHDGRAAYLKVDSIGNPQIDRAGVDGGHHFIPISELTYDLAPRPGSNDFTFTLSEGLGFGSALFLASGDARLVRQLYADPSHYLSYARWAPDGSRIAFIKIPDSQTPFTIGELWLMNADGSHPHRLATVDTGHGYAANWSPDGTRLAFVMRENADDPRADQSAKALISNIYTVTIETNQINQWTHFAEGRAETPRWSPDGNSLVFQNVLNGRMDLQAVDLTTGVVRPIWAEPACCPSWIRK